MTPDQKQLQVLRSELGQAKRRVIQLEKVIYVLKRNNLAMIEALEHIQTTSIDTLDVEFAAKVLDRVRENR